MLKGIVQLAAVETLARIRRDKEGKPRVLESLLTYIEENLFRKELTVTGCGQGVGVSAKTARRLFREWLHCSPWAYIRDRRMEVADQLLSSSDLRIWQIVEGVGYSTTGTFSKMLADWAGVSPEQYLKAVHNRQHTDNLYGRDFWRKLNRGEAEREQAEWALHQIDELYGLSRESPGYELSDPAIEDEVMAEVVWSRLRDKPFEEQKKVLSQQYGFRKPVLFHLLLAESRQVTTRDPRRAAQLAELALTSLDAAEWALRGDFPDLRARGAAWLGNARRRALDFLGAEEAFEKAEQAWRIPRPKKDFLALGDICLLRAGLRGDQRCFAEALSLVDDAIKIFRAEGVTERLAQALIERATIVGYSGHPQEALGELEEALEILERHHPDSSFLHLSAAANLATFYALSDRFEEAARLLPRAQALAAHTTVRTAGLHLCWTAGLVAQGQDDSRLAEDCFLGALRGFRALDESGYAAVAALELAVLYANQGRTSEALVLAADSIPVFEAFQIRREAIAALDLIREAVASSSLPVSMAKNIRGYLTALSKDPLFSRRASQQDEPPE